MKHRDKNRSNTRKILNNNNVHTHTHARTHPPTDHGVVFVVYLDVAWCSVCGLF